LLLLLLSLLFSSDSISSTNWFSSVDLGFMIYCKSCFSHRVFFLFIY
jgi:hypothetical protein